MPSLAIVLAAKHNSYSLQHWSVNMCRTYLKGGLARKCDGQFVGLVSPVPFCALTSSREGIKPRGRIGHRGMGLRPRILVSSNARLTQGDCMLTVDNVARSSIVAAILCLTLTKITLPRRRALAPAYMTKWPLAFVSRCQRSVPYKPRFSFLSRASPASVRRMSTIHLTVLSELTTGLPYIHLGHLAHERSRQRCSLEMIAYTAVYVGRRSGERERCTAPFILGLRRTLRRRSHCLPRGFLPE